MLKDEYEVRKKKRKDQYHQAPFKSTPFFTATAALNSLALKGLVEKTGGRLAHDGFAYICNAAGSMPTVSDLSIHSGTGLLALNDKQNFKLTLFQPTNLPKTTPESAVHFPSSTC